MSSKIEFQKWCMEMKRAVDKDPQNAGHKVLRIYSKDYLKMQAHAGFFAISRFAFLYTNSPKNSDFWLKFFQRYKDAASAFMVDQERIEYSRLPEKNIPVYQIQSSEFVYRTEYLLNKEYAEGICRFWEKEKKLRLQVIERSVDKCDTFGIIQMQDVKMLIITSREWMEDTLDFTLQNKFV